MIPQNRVRLYSSGTVNDLRTVSGVTPDADTNYRTLDSVLNELNAPKATRNYQLFDFERHGEKHKEDGDRLVFYDVDLVSTQLDGEVFISGKNVWDNLAGGYNVFVDPAIDPLFGRDVAELGYAPEWMDHGVYVGAMLSLAWVRQ